MIIFHIPALCIYFLVDIYFIGNFALYLYCTYIFHFFKVLIIFYHIPNRIYIQKKEIILIWSPLLLSFSYLTILPCTLPHIFLFQFRCSWIFSAIFFISDIVLIIFLPLIYQSTTKQTFILTPPALHSYCTYTSIHFQELHLLCAQNKHRKDFCLCSICQSNQVKQSHCRIRPFVSTLLCYIAAHERIL